MAFKLSKWYLDCVSDSGEASILYTGTAGWGTFHLNYSSLLETAGDAVITRQSFQAGGEPTVAGKSLLWRSDALQVDGEWKSDSTELRSTVFSSTEGSIEWHCLMPRARARIGRREGLGYAEHLAMTVAPWKIPLRTLRWGRFTSDSEWVVWIDWRGEYSQTLAYRNGGEVRISSLEDARIEFEDLSQLLMDRSLVIRDGPLRSTVLSAIPGVRDCLPVRILQVTECKWRSRARLQRCDGGTVEGWAIHERVEWPE
jgi:hypothetical protein